MQILKSADPPWGDYGSILWHGLAGESSTNESPLKLERAGPFIPPISFPWPTIVVTDSLCADLRALEPQGAALRLVELTRVVEINWHAWDTQAEEPAEYPASGEPEDYILKRKHSPAAASALPFLWELHVPESPGLQLEGGVFDPRHYADQDLCRGSRWGHIFVSDRLGDWLRQEVPDWVNLEQARVAG